MHNGRNTGPNTFIRGRLSRPIHRFDNLSILIRDFCLFFFFLVNMYHLCRIADFIVVFLHDNIIYVTLIPWLPTWFFLKDQDSRWLPLLLGEFCGLTLIKALQVQPWGWPLARMSASVSVMALSCAQSAVRNRPRILTVWGCVEESHFWGGSWNVSHHFKTAHAYEKDGAP